jgi:RNA polymerase sigma-70 factor (ECF subfamily)
MSRRSRQRAARAAFEAEVEGVLDALYDFASTLAPPAEADDLTQTACLSALEHWTSYTPGTRFKTWMFTILKNEFLTRHRSERRRTALRVELGVAVSDTTDGIETVLIANQWDAEVRDALLALPEIFRVPVYLKDVAGFAYAEIAQITGCPLGTVMSRLSRGRALLRATLVRQARERGLLAGPGAQREAR